VVCGSFTTSDVKLVQGAAQPCVQRTRLRRGATLAACKQGGVANNGSGQTRRAADAIVGRRRQGSAGGGQAKARVKRQKKRLGKAQVALRPCRRNGQRGC